MERRLEMVEDQMKQIQSGADTNLNIDVQEKDIQTPPQTADSMQSARSYTSGSVQFILLRSIKVNLPINFIPKIDFLLSKIINDLATARVSLICAFHGCIMEKFL